jgi:hypothetical protein
MNRLKLILAVVLAAAFIALPASAAKPEPSGTLAIAPGSDLTLGGVVTFDYTVDDLPGWANPRIQVICYQAGVVVYGMALNADPANGVPTATAQPFVLGGGSSDWLTNGGFAECEAILFYFDNRVDFQHVLDSLSFVAGG